MRSLAWTPARFYTRQPSLGIGKIPTPGAGKNGETENCRFQSDAAAMRCMIVCQSARWAVAPERLQPDISRKVR